TLARMTPDVIYDQMVAGGVASKLIFSWLGNPGVGSLHSIRRRIEDHDPGPLEIEEYSHFGMVCRYVAGASNLPFFPIRSYYESDIPSVNPKIVPMISPYYDRDNACYLEWDKIAREQSTLEAWLDEWVYGVADHGEYVEKYGAAHWDGLRPSPALSGAVDYGRYS